MNEWINNKMNDEIKLNGRFPRLKPKYKEIEAKVDPEIHLKIRHYCIKRGISLKKFASEAVERYYKDLELDDE